MKKTQPVVWEEGFKLEIYQHITLFSLRLWKFVLQVAYNHPCIDGQVGKKYSFEKIELMTSVFTTSCLFQWCI